MTNTVLGPAGSPMKPPGGDFSGKARDGRALSAYTVMGAGGSPMRPPYGSFAGKVAVVSTQGMMMTGWWPGLGR